MANTVNKTLLATILRKRQNSEPLNNEEEAYARKLFDSMMDSKKQVRKVVRIVTGEQLRKEQTLEKSKTDAEATRKDPRYPQGKNPQTIKAENTDPDVNSLKTKIPDADEKPKTGPHPGLEQDRVSSMTQEAVPPRTEAVKFVSADPVRAGDIVSKNMAKEGTHIVKGVVLKVKDGVAFVKWGDGRTMYEPAHLLVKVKKSDAAAAASEVKADPKLGPSESEEEAYNTPMTKGKVTHTRAYRQVKDKPGVKDPHALAQHIVEQAGGEKVQKDGGLAEAPDYSTSRPKTTPFQDLTTSLQDVVRLAGDLKGKAENTSDEDVKNEYEKLIGQLRGIAETILAGLSSELEEAEAEND